MARLLSQGSVGDDVKAVQDVLNFHIRRLQPLDVDGVFGSHTDTTVREFQRANGLQVDGIVGPETSGKLFEVVAVDFKIGLSLDEPEPFFRRRRIGIQPPRLIPELQWPGPGGPLPIPYPNGGLGGVPFLIPPVLIPPDSTRKIFPWDTNQPVYLNPTLIIPSRNDPGDPNVNLRKIGVNIINNLTDSPALRAFLIDQIPTESKITPPSGGGFGWGVKPLFSDILKAKVGLKGDLRYTLMLTGTSATKPSLMLGAYGEGEATADLGTFHGSTMPKTTLKWSTMLRLQGTF